MILTILLLLFDVINQTLKILFHPPFKHLEFRQKYCAVRRISTLFSVLGYPDETLSLVFDTSHQIKVERLLLALLNRKEPFAIGSSKW